MEEGASIFRKLRVGMKFSIDKTLAVVYNVDRAYGITVYAIRRSYSFPSQPCSDVGRDLVGELRDISCLSAVMICTTLSGVVHFFMLAPCLPGEGPSERLSADRASQGSNLRSPRRRAVLGEVKQEPPPIYGLACGA